MITPSDKQLLESTITQLRKIRERLDRSQNKVYKETGIHIGRIEAGHENVMLTTLLQLCIYYGVKHIEITDHSIVLHHVLLENEYKISN